MLVILRYVCYEYDELNALHKVKIEIFIATLVNVGIFKPVDKLHLQKLLKCLLRPEKPRKVRTT